MGPDEETTEEVLVRRRALAQRKNAELEKARKRIEAKYAQEAREIEEDLTAALLSDALNMALRALTPEQQKEVLGN